MSFTFSKEEFTDLIYSAREATIRFKRALTLYRSGNDDYSHWDFDTLSERIAHYHNLECRLRAKYEVAFGEAW